MTDRTIQVQLSLMDDEQNVETVEFRASEVLAHNGFSKSWDEFYEDDPYLQMSLAEDYALWNFKRKYGDNKEYQVYVVDGLTDETN